MVVDIDGSSFSVLFFSFNRFSNDKSFMKYDINGLFLDF